MKTNLIKIHIAAVALLSTFIFHPSSLLGQGALTPPGAPAPTMKTLTQVEPRTPISSAPFTISAPGSYYLTTNLTGVSGTNGITIATNGVTLDLNGFVLQGVSGSQDGVRVSGNYTNITVRNGTLSGWGDAGVNSGSSSSLNMVFERLNVSASYYGIYLNGAGGVIRDCNCENNSWTGIVSPGGIISGCTANNNKYGMEVGSGTVSGCFVENNRDSGIYVAAPGSEVIGNTCLGNNTDNSSYDAGICIQTSNSRVEDNHVTVSGYAGIQVYNYSSYTNNIIVKNTVINTAGTNYIFPAGQIIGPIITNTVSGVITNSNPWANFSF